ncbi:hydrolase 2, exosortase A system-associated [Methylibium rhizosphaerae]|uniref:hydrolase 2, exosortase A system-associated n=1 Tax=Methylibium rhizosphaerae TaxID=2570323 RepID=UPI001127C7BA|nr:hydrolase 2, exosortase A system-associated [Methylibium rhizosphaerae]
MNPAQPVVQSAAFVAGATGLRFRLVSEPAGGKARGTVVLAHAFAEEMNKSRRMCALLARGLAADGWRVVQRDLAGCGDSAGEFRDASWAEWIEDLEAELSPLDGSAAPTWLWCLRGGALLAPPLLARRPQVNLLLWQPAVSGAQHLQQFLRLHAGARIVGSAKGSGEQQTPAQMLRSGHTVEVGGYELSPALAGGLDQAGFDLPAGFAARVVWFELSADEHPEPSPAATRTADRLRERGVNVELEALHGPLFWQTQEIEACEALLQRSRACMNAAPPSSRGAATLLAAGSGGLAHGAAHG